MSSQIVRSITSFAKFRRSFNESVSINKMDRGTRNPIPDPPFIGRRAILKSILIVLAHESCASTWHLLLANETAELDNIVFRKASSKFSKTER
jgi:hypothetical protein